MQTRRRCGDDASGCRNGSRKSGSSEQVRDEISHLQGVGLRFALSAKAIERGATQRSTISADNGHRRTAIAHHRDVVQIEFGLEGSSISGRGLLPVTQKYFSHPDGSRSSLHRLEGLSVHCGLICLREPRNCRILTIRSWLIKPDTRPQSGVLISSVIFRRRRGLPS